MSKPVKNLVTEEYKDKFGELDSACVVSVIGLDGVSANRLRRELHAKKIKLQVVTNSLARRAFSESRLAPLGKGLTGPCAIVTGGESIIDVAKALVETKAKYPQIELKLGIVGGDAELIPVDQMAKMKSRQELIAEVAMLLASPGRRLAGSIGSPAGRIAGCVKAIVEKQEKGEGAAETAAA